MTNVRTPNWASMGWRIVRVDAARGLPGFAAYWTPEAVARAERTRVWFERSTDAITAALRRCDRPYYRHRLDSHASWGDGRYQSNCAETGCFRAFPSCRRPVIGGLHQVAAL